MGRRRRADGNHAEHGKGFRGNASRTEKSGHGNPYGCGLPAPFPSGIWKITDPVEKIKFTLAAYNAGIGHIYDAQRLAEKYGKDPYVWDDNVAEYIRMKNDPEYYNDPVCKHGYLRGSETFNYVREVMERYNYYLHKTGKK